MERAASGVRNAPDAERAQVVRRLREIMGANPNQAARIREIAAAAGLAPAVSR